jgi:hypothetical protein
MFVISISMAEIPIYYEGDDDRAALQALKTGSLLPDAEIAPRSKQHPGKDGLVAEVAPFIRPIDGVAGSAIVLVDLDDLNAEQVASWFHKGLADQLSKAPPTAIDRRNLEDARLALFKLTGGGKTGRAVLIPVGLAEDSVITKNYGIDRFAIDDYLLRLVCDTPTYNAMTDFADIPQEKALSKLLEFVNLLRGNEIPIQNSKRFLHLIRAITSFRPSSAVFVERLVGKAIAGPGRERVRQLLQPLLDDIAAAARTLVATAATP